MAQSAMSGTIWDGEWDPLPYKLDEWLLFEDKLEKKEVDDTSYNLSKYEIAEEVLHNIEDLGRNDNADWLDEFPLFDELQSLPPIEEMELDPKRKSEHLELQPEHSCPGVAVENHNQQPTSKDLFSVSYENAATFILTNKNIFYIDRQPFINLTPFQPQEDTKEIKCKEEKIIEKEPESSGDDYSEDGSARPGFWSDLDSPHARSEMEVVDKILRNTALELAQWESDTSRSETSSDETSSDSLPKKRKFEDEDEEKGEETDDPDWKPENVKSGERTTYPNRSKRYKRGGSQEEKKLRKKEQNKNAAIRYRQKKKAEADEILKEEKILREKKTQLEKKVADIQNEIKCVKALMRDLFKATGIIK